MKDGYIDPVWRKQVEEEFYTPIEERDKLLAEQDALIAELDGLIAEQKIRAIEPERMKATQEKIRQIRLEAARLVNHTGPHSYAEINKLT